MDSKCGSCLYFKTEFGILTFREKTPRELYGCGAGQFNITADKSKLPKECNVFRVEPYIAKT